MMEFHPPLLGLTKSQRAMIAARYFIDRKKRRRQWLLAARAAFTPGDRHPCVICGAYQGLAHAHHVLPLSIQFNAGLAEPDHEFVWLCPTHHEAAHEIIRGLLANVQPDLTGMPPAEKDALQPIGVRFVEKLVSAGGLR